VKTVRPTTAECGLANIYKMLTNLMKSYELTASTHPPVYVILQVCKTTFCNKFLVTRNKMQVPFLEFGGMIQSIMSSGDTGGQWWHAGCW